MAALTPSVVRSIARQAVAYGAHKIDTYTGWRPCPMCYQRIEGHAHPSGETREAAVERAIRDHLTGTCRGVR